MEQPVDRGRAYLTFEHHFLGLTCIFVSWTAVFDSPPDWAVSIRWQDASMSLPLPREDTSLILRTEFSDDAAWDALKAAIDAEDEHGEATYVSDPAYDGVTVQSLIDADVAANDDAKVCHVFVADSVALKGGEHALLVVDLFSPPYQMVRVAPAAFAEVSANLIIANLDVADYADEDDPEWIYRGSDY
jgi:hypothetical protein